MVFFDVTKDKTPLNKRLLHERSNIALEFPVGLERFYRVFIPMLENPQITETGRARIKSYDLVGRAGQLFSYGGADSRKLNLTFNISLLHLFEMDMKEGIADRFKRQFRLFFEDRKTQERLFELRDEPIDARVEIEAEQNGFVSDETYELLQERDELEDSLTKGVIEPLDNDSDREYGAAHREYYRKIANLITTQDIANQESNSLVTPLLTGLGVNLASDNINQINGLIDLIILWVNLIRATVLNDSQNTSYGPPILRLNHGTMYNNVPCLVENYDIRILDEAGYDVDTLTPKRLEITLGLVENRAGNFGSYGVGAIQDGDNLTGWESIINSNDYDPFNGVISVTQNEGNVEVNQR